MTSRKTNESIERTKEGDIKKVITERKPTSHKGDFGRVLIIAGSEDYPGASILAAKAAVNSIAALRTGVDIVTIAAPEKVGWLMHQYLPDIIIKKYPCRQFTEIHADEIIKLAKDKDAVLIGPGLGRNSDKFVRKIVKSAKTGGIKNLVMDADALKAVKIDEIKCAVLTPHEKEFEYLTGKKLPKSLNKKIAMVKKYAKENVILLKGNPDIIAYKDKIKLNYTGNPAMTVGGTGDVLAGLCTGFLAQANKKEKGREDKINKIKFNAENRFNSACAAAFINGMAGDIVEEEIGNGLIASDLLKVIARIIKKRLELKRSG